MADLLGMIIGTLTGFLMLGGLSSLCAGIKHRERHCDPAGWSIATHWSSPAICFCGVWLTDWLIDGREDYLIPLVGGVCILWLAIGRAASRWPPRADQATSRISR